VRPAWRRWFRFIWVTAVLIVAVVGTNVAGHASVSEIDLSAGRHFSLAPASRAVAKAVSAPLHVTAAGGPGVVDSRVFVTGSDVWMTNQFLDDLGNRRFFANALNWLASQDQLVVATSPPNVSRPLPLTPARQTEILLVTVGLVPGAILGGGVALRLLARLLRRR